MTQHSRNTPQFYLTAPSPCPYLPGQEERKVFTHLVGRARGRAQRPPHPRRLPPQPVDRLPAGLRDLPGLRVGAGRRRGFPADAQHAPHRRAQCRPGRRNAGRGADLRAVFGVPLLSRRPPSRRRHGRHDGARLRHDGRGQPRRDPHGRIPAARARQQPSTAAAPVRCSRSRSPTCSATGSRWSIRSSTRTWRCARSALS